MKVIGQKAKWKVREYFIVVTEDMKEIGKMI